MHDVENDVLMLLIIKDFANFEIKEVEISKKKEDVKVLLDRCSSNTYQSLLHVTTMFMSFEFENILLKLFKN